MTLRTLIAGSTSRRLFATLAVIGAAAAGTHLASTALLTTLFAFLVIMEVWRLPTVGRDELAAELDEIGWDWLEELQLDETSHHAAA